MISTIIAAGLLPVAVFVAYGLGCRSGWISQLGRIRHLEDNLEDAQSDLRSLREDLAEEAEMGRHA